MLLFNFRRRSNCKKVGFIFGGTVDMVITKH